MFICPPTLHGRRGDLKGLKILIASLDGLVFYNGEMYGLEIKCPYSKFNKSLQEALCDKKFFLHENNGIKLKRRHPYYYQVQGQMFCANLRKVDFVVWFGDNEPLFKETICYDEDFMLNFVFPRLKYFYCRAVLPEFFYLPMGIRNLLSVQ